MMYQKNMSNWIVEQKKNTDERERERARKNAQMIKSCSTYVRNAIDSSIGIQLYFLMLF